MRHMHQKRRLLLLFLGPALSLVLSTNCPAQSGDFPNRPVQFVVPFSPGASTDLMARFIANPLSEVLGKPVVVENRAGAGGIVGAAAVAKAPADGHTLLVASSTVLQSPLLQKTPAFSASANFTPVIAVSQHPFAVISTATIPVRTFSEFRRYAEENPGKVNTGSLGGFSDVISEMLIHAAGIKAQIIPYRGAAEAMIGVIRGDAHVMFTVYGAAQSQIAKDQVRLIAVTSLHRSPPIPDVPTLDESGLKGFDVINVIGILAPAGTPAPIVDRLNREIAKIMQSQKGREFVASLGNEVMDDYSPDHYRAQIAAADQKYRVIIDQLGIPKQ